MTGIKTVYIALGSNLGDRAGTLAQAIDALTATGIRVVRSSSFYETEPVEVAAAQPWFVNCVVALETELMPRQLLARTRAIELAMGRRRDWPRAPRTVDIDIVLFGNTVSNAEGLTIPHPRMDRRRFVLEPLAEIAAEVEHPVLHQSAREMLRVLPAGEGQVRKLKEE